MLIYLKRSVYTLFGLTFLIWLVTFLILKFENHEYIKITSKQQNQATAYLEGKTTSAPSNWAFETFTPEHGVDLRTGHIDAINSKGTVIFVPGFTGTIEMAMEEITQLNKAGFRSLPLNTEAKENRTAPLVILKKDMLKTTDCWQATSQNSREK